MIFCQVVRVYKAKRRVVYEGDNRERAEREYEKIAEPMRDGDLALYIDGVQERAAHCGYMRRHW